LVEGTTFYDWSSRFESLQVDIWLAQDNLRAAAHWSGEMLQEEARKGRPESDEAQLALAHVLFVQGDKGALQHVLTLLDGLLETAAEEGRTGIEIKCLALQSLTYWAQGKQVDARVALERALRKAQPEGFTRLFVDLGLPMGRLLQEVHSRGVIPEYVATLLAAFGRPPEGTVATAATLPERLSRRERQVLDLVASGLTNREIAEQLVVSPETVKKHARNIYAKLGVSNRMEAATRARALGLLD